MSSDKTSSGFFGFLYDWVMSRKWKKMLIPGIPVGLLVLAYGVSVWGSTMNPSKLANWYQKLGEEELEKWESSLTAATPPSTEGEEEGEPPEEADEQAEEDDSQKISPFAEMLFRRLQVLNPSDRSKFVIGVTYAQQGAFEQAFPIFDSLAPYGRRGYPPAHAYLAMSLLEQIKQGKIRITEESRDLLVHHIREAQGWEKVPQSLLLDGAGLFSAYAEQENATEYSRESLTLLSRAAERDTSYSLDLAKQAEKFGNMVVRDAALARANAYLGKKLREDPNDDVIRAKYADTMAMDGKFDEAEKVLTEGMQIRQTGFLTRSLSELYRIKFVKSIRKEEGRFVGSLELLDKAMRIDPQNPNVVNEIARLARLGGQRPTDEMIDALQNRLATGQATAVTHAWLSEAYLLKEQYKKAIPHLEQVNTRMPQAPQFANNLAFVLADLYPERLGEAVKHAERAVFHGRKTLDPNLADFYDTLGTIYGRLDRLQESITAFELAIQLKPRRVDFRERVAQAYQANGNEEMAAAHLKIREQLLAEPTLNEPVENQGSQPSETQETEVSNE